MALIAHGPEIFLCRIRLIPIDMVHETRRRCRPSPQAFSAQRIPSKFHFSHAPPGCRVQELALRILVPLDIVPAYLRFEVGHAVNAADGALWDQVRASSSAWTSS